MKEILIILYKIEYLLLIFMFVMVTSGLLRSSKLAVNIQYANAHSSLYVQNKIKELNTGKLEREIIGLTRVSPESSHAE